MINDDNAAPSIVISSFSHTATVNIIKPVAMESKITHTDSSDTIVRTDSVTKML